MSEEYISPITVPTYAVDYVFNHIGSIIGGKFYLANFGDFNNGDEQTIFHTCNEFYPSYVGLMPMPEGAD